MYRIQDPAKVDVRPNDITISTNDNCGITSIALVGGTPNLIFGTVGQWEQVTIEVEDAVGNQATCIDSIFVEDTVAPEALCKGTQIITIVSTPNNESSESN